MLWDKKSSYCYNLVVVCSVDVGVGVKKNNHWEPIDDFPPDEHWKEGDSRPLCEACKKRQQSPGSELCG